MLVVNVMSVLSAFQNRPVCFAPQRAHLPLTIMWLPHFRQRISGFRILNQANGCTFRPDIIHSKHGSRIILISPC